MYIFIYSCIYETDKLFHRNGESPKSREHPTQEAVCFQPNWSIDRLEALLVWWWVAGHGSCSEAGTWVHTSGGHCQLAKAFGVGLVEFWKKWIKVSIGVTDQTDPTRRRSAHSIQVFTQLPERYIWWRLFFLLFSLDFFFWVVQRMSQAVSKRG